MFDDVRHRCATDKPILAVAIRALAYDAPLPVRPELKRLAKGLLRRTTIRPKTVSVEAVSAAIDQLLSHMVDREPFARRHESALCYLRGQG